VAASPNRFAVAYDDTARQIGDNHQVAVTYVDARTGVRSGRVPIEMISDYTNLFGLQLAYDGSRFMYSRGAGGDEEVGQYGLLARISSGSVITMRSGPILAAARLASLGGGRSLLVATVPSEPTIAVAPVLDAP
jgi:hypothetical protein